MINFGLVPSGAVLPIFFDAFAGSTGASITITGLAVTDIEIYKGVSMTQRSSDNGYALIDTDGIDLDGITGIHGFSVDTGDNTDAGFYAVGSFFTVVVSAITVDGQTVNFVAATFRMATAEGTAGQPVVSSVTGAVGSVTGAVGSVTGAVGSVTGAVGSVTGNVGGNVVGSVASVTAGVTVTTNNDKTGYALSAAGVDAVIDDAVDGATTLRQLLRGFAAALLGKASGLATTTAVYRDVGDTKNRISATVDADGNRSAVTLDLT